MYDNTSLDYALKIDGKPRLFVEAKGIGKSLDDKGFIARPSTTLTTKACCGAC